MSKHINEENQFVKNCSNCFIPINSTYYIFCCHCGGKATKKICANCNLQATDPTDNSWIMECFCGCNATAILCSTCLKEHSEIFPLRICFSEM